MVPKHSLGTEGQGDRGIKRPRDKGTNGQRDKGTKGQRDKETKGQRDKRTRGQRDKSKVNVEIFFKTFFIWKKNDGRASLWRVC